MKVKYLKDDEGAGKKAGDIDYLHWDVAQSMQQAGAIEILNAEDEEDKTPEADKAETTEAETGGGVEYEAMTRAELEAEAHRRGVDISGSKTKAEVIEVLRASDGV